ncbi:MAG: DUF3386 family protein [Isosphaeraceae bacterium]
MTRTWLLLALLAPAFVLSLSAARADDDARARKMMEEAFNRRYRWNEGFKGFSADFSCTREGKTVKGTLKVDAARPHGGVAVECDDADVKKMVSDTIASTVTHTRASSFEKGFGSCTFAIAGDGAHGGTKIAITGHGFFKDFTVKEGNIIENHGGHDAMSSEVKVQQIVWMADSGKTLPRAYAFTIKNGDREQSGKNMEMWREIQGVWLPARWHMVRNEGSAAAVESTLILDNIKVEQAGN